MVSNNKINFGYIPGTQSMSRSNNSKNKFNMTNKDDNQILANAIANSGDIFQLKDSKPKKKLVNQ